MAGDTVLSDLEDANYTPGAPPLGGLCGDTPVNFKIAFLGDQGNGSTSTKVLDLIKDEGAQAVVHAGVFDYDDDPQGWDDRISSVLGADFPYFANAGNHDDQAYYGSEPLQRR